MIKRTIHLPYQTQPVDSKNRKEIDNKVALYFQTFFQVDEFSFMQIHTDEENYTDYMNLYTDLIWVKNKLGLTIWNRKKMSYFI